MTEASKYNRKLGLQGLQYQTPLIIVTGVLLISIIGLLLNVIFNDAAVKEDTRHAKIYSTIMSEMRSFYLKEVVNRVNGSDVMVRHDFREFPKSIPIPTTMSMEFASFLNSRIPELNFALVSRYPFPWRSNRELADFDRRAIEALSASGSEDYSEIINENGFDVLHYASPIIMTEGCVFCHNSHPDSPKTDWKVGDVRGIQVIELPVVGGYKAGMREVALITIVTASGFASILTLLFLSKRAASANARLLRKNVELEEEKARANIASEAKSNFLSKMSHEIRTPLNGILGTLQLFEEGTLSRSNKESLEVVRKSSRTLLNIVNGILDISKIEANEEVATQNRAFEIRTLIADILYQHSSLFGDKNIDLLVRIEGSLPQFLRSDPMKIEQILNNLLSNALKFTEEGKVTLELRWLQETDGDVRQSGSAEFIVSDTGIGIKSENIPQLFEPFKQVDDSLTRRYMGTGLGLSIVRSIAKQLGGDVMIQSEFGVGTSVRVVLANVIDHQETPYLRSEMVESGHLEFMFFGEHETVFRASQLLDTLGGKSRFVHSPSDAETFLRDPPTSTQAIVVDRGFNEDAIVWLNRLAEKNQLRENLPIIVIRSTRHYPDLVSKPPVHEVRERFGQSNFLEILQEVGAISEPITLLKNEGRANESEASGKLGMLRILVVDDNSINRRVMIRLLGNNGIENVEAASSAAEAVELLKQRAFDVVFMDLQMPDIDGYTATQMIRRLGLKDLKIFACSAHAFETDVMRSLSNGLDGHISKPIDSTELVALLNGLLMPVLPAKGQSQS